MMVRYALLAAGWLALALGTIGIFLPLLPTTPFVLLAAVCFAKASPRFHHWLLQHKTFGPIVYNWQEHRAVPLPAKMLSSSMMALSTYMVYYRFPEMVWVWSMCGITCLCVAIWIWRLPHR